MSEDVALQKGKAFFNLVGNPRITDLTFKIDEVSASGYKYSRFNLGVETAPGNVVYCDCMGGYHTTKNTTLYASSKEDFTKQMEIDWEDRFDENILNSINDLKFVKVGLETYEENGVKKTLVKKFLSWYDAIPYVKDYLSIDSVVNVNGNLKYSFYNGKLQIKKEITSIYLSKETDAAKFKATFVQSILLDKHSITKDKDNNEYIVTARVIDYLKNLGETEIKKNVPYVLNYTIEQADAERTTKMLSKFFKVKKGITELTVEGNILEGTQMAAITEDDIPDDIKELIELGIYDKDEILGKMAIRGERISKLIITRPYILKTIKDDGSANIQIFTTPEKYVEDDLLFDFEPEEKKEEIINEAPTDAPDKDAVKDTESNDDSWLSDL
jgi:hypothetical protein